MLQHVTVDLCAVNLQTRCESLSHWLADLERRMAGAAERGVQLVVLPEFCCAQWLSFAPVSLSPELHLAWLADTGVIALETMKKFAMAYGVSLIAGTIPFASKDRTGKAGYLNRAWLLYPDGTSDFQDKLSLTPLEAEGAGGVTLHGLDFKVMNWHGLRLGIVICLDAEYTALWSRLGELDLDIVVVPAKTDMVTGYNRVFCCAKARAIELQTVVCVVGAVGAPMTNIAEDTGVGGAAVFLPCDVSVSLDGTHALLPPRTAAGGADAVLNAAAVPVGLCRALRHGGAEAELRPALWDADHVRVRESDRPAA